MGKYIAPFDLRKILVDYLLGSNVLLAFALIIGYSLLAARFGFSNKIYLTLLVISSVIMGVFLGEAIYVLVLVLVGFAVFKTFGRLFT